MNNSSDSSSTADAPPDWVPRTAETGRYTKLADLTDEDTAWVCDFVVSLPQGFSPMEIENLYHQQQTLEGKQDAFYKDFVTANTKLWGLLEMARIEDAEVRRQLDEGVKTVHDMVGQQYEQLRNDHLSLHLDIFARINDMFLGMQRQLVEMRLKDRNKVAATARQEAEEAANRAQEILKKRFEEAIEEQKMMETRLQEVQEKAQESIRSLMVVNHRLQSEVNARSDALENEMRVQEEVKTLNSQIEKLQMKLNEKVAQISAINSEMERFGLDKNTVIKALEAYVKINEAKKETELQKDVEKELRVQLKTMTFERDCLATALHMSADDIVQLVRAMLWDMEQEERVLKRMMSEEDSWRDMKLVSHDELATQLAPLSRLQDHANTEATSASAPETSGTQTLRQHVYTNLNAEKEVEKLKEQLRQAVEAREVAETKVAAYEKSHGESDFHMRFEEMETEPADTTSITHDAHEPFLRPISRTSSFFSPPNRDSMIGPIGTSLLDELGSEAFGSRPQSMYGDIVQHMSNPVTLIQREPHSESTTPVCAMTERSDLPAGIHQLAAENTFHEDESPDVRIIKQMYSVENNPTAAQPSPEEVTAYEKMTGKIDEAESASDQRQQEILTHIVKDSGTFSKIENLESKVMGLEKELLAGQAAREAAEAELSTTRMDLSMVTDKMLTAETELAKVRAILEEQLQEQGQFGIQADRLGATKQDLTILKGKTSEMRMNSEQCNEDELRRLAAELEAKKVEAANAKAQTESVLAALTEMKKRVYHSSEEEGTWSLEEFQDYRPRRGSQWTELVEQEIDVLPMPQDSEESGESSEQNQRKHQAALIGNDDGEEEEVDEDATIPPQQGNHIQGAPPQEGPLTPHENNSPLQQPCLCLDCATQGARCPRCSRQVIAAGRTRVVHVPVNNVPAPIDPSWASYALHHIVSAWLRLLAFLFLQSFLLLGLGFFHTRKFVGSYIPCIRPGINVQVPVLLSSLGWVDTLLVSATLAAFIIIALPLLTSNAAYRERQIWLGANDFTRMYLLDVQTYSPYWRVLLGVDPRLLFQFSSF